MRASLAVVLVTAQMVGVLAASGARGQTIDPDKAKDWLERTYGIKTERVAEATPDELVILRTVEPRPPSDFHVIAHFETFTPPDPLTPPSSDREYLINCPSRRFHVDRIESFSEHGARGAQSTSYGPNVWGLAVPASPDEGVISAVCGPSAAAIALQAARQAAAAIPDPAPLPAPAPKAAVQARPRPPAPPAAQERKPPPTIPPAAKPAPKPAPETGSTRVQLFAGDKTSAQHLVDGLPARLAAVKGPGKPEIVAGALYGRPIYRVQITGFASPADAARFCSAARAAGQDCFVPPQMGR